MIHIREQLGVMKKSDVVPIEAVPAVLVQIPEIVSV